jgi:hypothetical protein
MMGPRFDFDLAGKALEGGAPVVMVGTSAGASTPVVMVGTSAGAST